MIQASILSSFILFDLSNRPHKQPRNMTLLNFQKNLATQLIGDFTSRKVANKVETACVLQKLVKGTCRQCTFCAINEIYEIKGKPVRPTSFTCEACAVPLCQYECFNNYYRAKFVQDMFSRTYLTQTLCKLRSIL